MTSARPVRSGAQRTPAVSVVTPAHNAAATLSETIASVVGQVGVDWEMIIVENGSADETWRLATEAAAADARIRAMSVNTRGPSNARNEGCAQARGQWVLFLDADDVLLPGALGRLLAAAEAEPDAVITGGLQYRTEQGRELPVQHFARWIRFDRGELLSGNRMPTSTALLPRHQLPPRPFDETLWHCEEWELWGRLAAAGLRCRVLPEVLFGYRLRAASLGHDPVPLFRGGLRVLERLASPTEEAQHAQARCRWALSCGALAAAGGSPHLLAGFLDAVGNPRLEDCWTAPCADAFHWAYQYRHGAAGELWATHSVGWITEIQATLQGSPLGSLTDGIVRGLRQRARTLDTIALEVIAWAEAHQYESIVLYGCGTNGIRLVHQLKPLAGDVGLKLLVADDALDPAVVRALGVGTTEVDAAGVDGRVGIVVTPYRVDRMVERLRGLGGRPGIDFITLDDLRRESGALLEAGGCPT